MKYCVLLGTVLFLQGPGLLSHHRRPAILGFKKIVGLMAQYLLVYNSSYTEPGRCSVPLSYT